MTVQREFTVWCDHADADGTMCGWWELFASSTITRARKMARRAGWVRGKNRGKAKDYCPQHAKEHGDG